MQQTRKLGSKLNNIKVVPGCTNRDKVWRLPVHRLRPIGCTRCWSWSLIPTTEEVLKGWLQSCCHCAYSTLQRNSIHRTDFDVSARNSMPINGVLYWKRFRVTIILQTTKNLVRLWITWDQKATFKCSRQVGPFQKLHEVVIRNAAMHSELLQVANVHSLVLAKSDAFKYGRPFKFECDILKIKNVKRHC